MVVPSAETDFVGYFRRQTYHLHFFLHFDLKEALMNKAVPGNDDD